MDLLPFLGWVTHVCVGIHSILVSAPVALAVDVARLDEVGEDPLCRPFGDPDLLSDVAEPDIRGSGDAEENLGVVGEEPPGVRLVFFT